MTEELLLSKIFGELWRDKYPICWCELCDSFYISCEKCKQATCSDAGCEECEQDFEDFSRLGKSPFGYLSEQEIMAFSKMKALKKHIKTSLLAGFSGVNWKWLKEEGKTCKKDETWFPEIQQFKYKHD